MFSIFNFLSAKLLMSDLLVDDRQLQRIDVLVFRPEEHTGHACEVELLHGDPLLAVFEVLI